MSDTASHWNKRYSEPAAPLPGPALVLLEGARWLPAVAETGAVHTGAVHTGAVPAGADNTDAEHGGARPRPAVALDMACGRAGNGEWLARRGFHVSAWDISDVVIDEIRRRKPQWIACAEVRDVTQDPPAPESFDIIVVCRFLERSLCPAIANALVPGGTLFYQTFTQGLSTPDFMLNPGELPQLFPDLQILHYHEPGPDGSGKAEARLVARRV